MSVRAARSDIRHHATLPQSWIQPENWEFETHRVRAAMRLPFDRRRLACAATLGVGEQ